MKKEVKFNSKKGQVWVETIIYTLITFIIITLVISFASPQIEKIRDRAVIEKSTEILQEIHTTIDSIGSAGNKRLIEISLRKGDLKIDSSNDEIIFSMETILEYSEPGEEIENGCINIITEDKGSFNIVTLTVDYPSYNLTYGGQEQNKTLSNSDVDYSLLISNEGNSINFELN